MSGWIEIVDWDRFQHYKDRDPTWIKVYARLMSDDDFRDLSFHLRGVLVSLWIEYARSNRQIRDTTVTLTRQLGHRVLTRDIERLSHAGFIRISASKPLAPRYPREEVLRTSSKKPLARRPQGGDAAAARAEENKLERDPDALQKIRAMADKIGLRIDG